MFHQSDLWLLIRSACHDIGDTQLQWTQLMGHHGCGTIAFTTGVGNASQPSPDLDMTDGTDACPWVDVPIEKDIALGLQMIPGAKRALVKEQR